MEIISTANKYSTGKRMDIVIEVISTAQVYE